MGSLAKQLQKSIQPGQRVCKKDGGSIKHSDAAADRKLSAQELKKTGLKKGGRCK